MHRKQTLCNRYTVYIHYTRSADSGYNHTAARGGNT